MTMLPLTLSMPVLRDAHALRAVVDAKISGSTQAVLVDSQAMHSPGYECQQRAEIEHSQRVGLMRLNANRYESL